MAAEQTSPRRHNSEVLIREAFPPVLDTELPCLEEELKKIQDELNTRDKRHLGSVIGGGIFALLGFLLLSPTVVGGVAGGVVGLGVGHLIGRSVRKRQRVTLLDINMDKVYHLRLVCLLRYLERKMKAKTPLDVFLRMIERVVCEFRPALVLALHNIKLAKCVDVLVRLLRKDACHAALLNGIAELAQMHSSSTSVTLVVTRLKYFFIPVMELVRQTSPRRAQFEVVYQIERLLKKKSVQELMTRHAKEVEAIVEGVGGDIPSMMPMSPEFSLAAAKIDDALDSTDEYKGNEQLIFRRCASLQSDMSIHGSYKHQVESTVMKAMANAYLDSNRSGQRLEPVPEVEEEKSASRSRAMSGQFSLRSNPPTVLIQGTTNELMESSDDEVSPMDGPVAAEEITPVLVDDGPKGTEVDLKLHPFHADFDNLLVIEAEPRGGKTWQQVVDKPGVQVYKKRTEGTPICMIKAFCAIPYSKEVVFKAIWDTDVRSRWDEVFEEFRTIDVQPDYDVLYYMIKVTATQTPTSLVTKRDWVQRRCFIRDYPDPNCIMMHFISMEHPMMPVKRKVIRAETVISGYIIRPTGEKTCDMTIISQNDIKGLIPKMIVNRFASKAPADWINNLLKGCQFVTREFPDI